MYVPEESPFQSLSDLWARYGIELTYIYAFWKSGVFLCSLFQVS
jgi:hypothetical protein